MAESFKVTWEVEDGYVGGARPHHFDIEPDDVVGFETDKDLTEYFWQCISDEFMQKASPVCNQGEAFLAWAKALPKDED